jgi:hypothetical protein
MKRLLPLLLLLPLGACSEKVKVNVHGGTQDYVEGRLVAYGVETLYVTCQPLRDITYSELLIDRAVVDVDTSPGPWSNIFEWDVRQLPEAGVHILEARAISGSREYLSPELSVKVGYRSRLVIDGPQRSFYVYRPDAKLEGIFAPYEDAHPSYPRFRPGCHEIVFVADHRLYNFDTRDRPPKPARVLAQVANGIHSCDASPVSDLVAFEGYPAGTAHLFTLDGSGDQRQLTHDSDFVIIDSSRFTCIANSTPVFSPDGSRLAYFRESKCLVPGDPHEHETREDAFVMNSNGSNPVNLTAGVDDAHFSGFTWTFDGKWVLFRAGTSSAPAGELAANMSGHAITGLEIGSVALACSPYDSTVIYVGARLERHLFSMKLAWTVDTLYVSQPGIFLGGEDYPQRDYVDWVKYSGR